MALYKAGTEPPAGHERIDGIVWAPPGPGATLRRWAPVRPCQSAQFARMNADAIVLDRKYETLSGETKARWVSWYDEWEDMWYCWPAMDVGAVIGGPPLTPPTEWMALAEILSPAIPVWIETPTGRFGGGARYIYGWWGWGEFTDWGGGTGLILLHIGRSCEIVDWPPPGVGGMSYLYWWWLSPFVHGVWVDGVKLPMGAWFGIDRNANPPPCTVQIG